MALNLNKKRKTDHQHQIEKKIKHIVSSSESESEDERESEDEENEELDTKDTLDSDNESDSGQDADESQGESESGGDSEIEEINAAAHEKRPKRKKNQDPDSFSAAMTAILGSHLKAHDRSDPVLVRSKSTARAIEDAKLEAKAKHALRAERRALADKERVKDVISGLRKDEEKKADPEATRKNTELEIKLKKTAKRGVVKLFNTIIEAQKKAVSADV
ncbi:Rrp15p-domain-containing protein [Lipomyces oligophaga]|uniref:Rrp15p-domain-containing protein n=1 Tax=Lipomyces oligophaga TaxID=45792 RepID=UPI0034CDAFDE